RHSEIFVVVVNTEELGVFTDDVERLRSAVVVVIVKRNIPPVVRIDLPRIDFARVADAVISWVDEFEFACRRHTDIHPGIVRLFQWRLVMPERAGREVSFIAGQIDLYSPVRLGQQVERADVAAGTSVGFCFRVVVDGCRAVRRMANDAIIGFYPSAGPGAAHSDIPELDNLVIVQKGLSGGFVPCSPNFSTDLGEDQDFDEFVLQLDGLPRLWGRPMLVTIKAEVRIDPPELRNWIGIGKSISRKSLSTFFDRGCLVLCDSPREDQGKDEED